MELPAVSPADFVVFVGVVVASVTDIKYGLIPNKLNIPLILAGIVICSIAGEPTLALYGILVAFALHYVLWTLGVERGGDAKLMIAIGALWGWSGALEATFWYGIVYIPVGLIVLIYKGRMRNLAKVAKSTALGAKTDESEMTMLKTAPIIAVAAIATWATSWLDPRILFGG